MEKTNYNSMFFIRPLLFQELVTYILCTPFLAFFIYFCLPRAHPSFPYAIMLTNLLVPFSTGLSVIIKYTLTRPIIRAMQADADNEAMHRAVRPAAWLPIVDACVVVFRWVVLTNVCVSLVLFLQGHIYLPEFLFLCAIIACTGFSLVTLYYLAAETSLFPFYQKIGRFDVLENEKGLVRIGLGKKLIISNLLTGMVPIVYLIAVIFISAATKVDLSGMWVGFVLLFIETIAMTVINSMLIMRGFSGSVGEMSRILKDMAQGQGDLTRRLKINGIDEVGELAYWFNSFVGNMDEVITQVRDATMRVFTASHELSASSQSVSQNTQGQASSVEEVAAAVDGMHASINLNTNLVRDGKETAFAMKASGDIGSTVFGELAQAIGEISSVSRRIGDIVTTVNEVAFQTNLLALNAAVEAARAGEQGRGFAVVAQEVRALAGRSAEAARQIRGLIEETVARINTGDEMMKKASSSLTEIMSHMGSLARIMEQIESSSNEQAHGIAELNQAINSIDSSTQHNAATVEELAGTAEAMRTEADTLTDIVRRFKVSKKVPPSAAPTL